MRLFSVAKVHIKNELTKKIGKINLYHRYFISILKVYLLVHLLYYI